MNGTTIAWVQNPDGTPGFTWNPFSGCRRVSPGCQHCYAERLTATRLAHLPAYKGLAYVYDAEDSAKGRIVDRYRWSGEVRFHPEKLAEPLRRKPAGIFVCDMADLFNEANPDEQIAAVFGVMSACPQHIFYVLTKRAKRMREWFEWTKAEGKRRGGPLQVCWEASACHKEVALRVDQSSDEWPLPNVRVGVTCENQRTAEERIPELLQTPAVLRWLSVEPQLEEISMRWLPAWPENAPTTAMKRTGNTRDLDGLRRLDWIVQGGESGPHARPFRVEWARLLRDQCKASGVAYFLKQMGANCIDGNDRGFPASKWPDAGMGMKIAPMDAQGMRVFLHDRAGADPAEWPEDLRVRQMPVVKP